MRGGWREILPAPADNAAGTTLVPDRASRLPRLIGAREDAGAALNGMSVLIAGAGAVGGAAALNLARLQPAEIRIVDRGRFKGESLLTQPIATSDIGAWKASSIAHRCKKISPRTRVLAFDGAVEDLDLTAFLGVGLVLLFTDNLAAESEVGSRCVRLGLPLAQGSVHGPSLIAQVRFFANVDGAGPCPICAYGQTEWADLHRQTRFSCERSESLSGGMEAHGAPTRSPSFLVSLAADLTLAQSFRWLLRAGAHVDDTMLEYCAITHRTTISPLRRNDRCAGEHVFWQPAGPGVTPADCTLEDLLQRSGFVHGSDFPHPLEVFFQVSGAAFVELARCRCRPAIPVGRFVRRGEDLGLCSLCGHRVVSLPIHTHDRAPARLVRPILHRSLEELGIADAPYLVLRQGEQARMFRTAGVTAPLWIREDNAEGEEHADDGACV